MVLGPRSLEREEKSGVTLSGEDPLDPLQAGFGLGRDGGWEGGRG